MQAGSDSFFLGWQIEIFFLVNVTFLSSFSSTVSPDLHAPSRANHRPPLFAFVFDELSLATAEALVLTSRFEMVPFQSYPSHL